MPGSRNWLRPPARTRPSAARPSRPSSKAAPCSSSARPERAKPIRPTAPSANSPSPGVAARWGITTTADLYAALRPRHGIDSEAEFRRYRDARILLIDDLGADRKPTEFTEEVNFRLINHRYENHMPTLITSNLLPKEISERLGDRVTSRLIEMCQRVIFKGADRRRGEAA
jgi:hypothetical protein